VSPAYVQHTAAATCVSCHTSRQEIVPYKYAAYRPSCAACHANEFVPTMHHKVDNPLMLYGVLELKDCSGSCHVYSDTRLLSIKRMLTGRHHATDGAF